MKGKKMDNITKPVPATGINGATLLTILFVGLKLTNQIDWSWWWVLSPLWISFGLIFVLLLLAALCLAARGTADCD